MVKRRLIPVVLLRNGVAVQSKGFRRYQRLGNPTTIVERLSDWAADELIYLDISREGSYDLGRDDLHATNAGDILSILRAVSRECFMPMTFGGGIRTLDDCAARLQAGADKVVINSAALDVPRFIDECAAAFGAQCVVVGIDVKTAPADAERPGQLEVFKEGGRTPTARCPVAWAREAETRGAGEVLVQSIDRDGRGHGYDLELVSAVSAAVGIPVIALGGAGSWTHLSEGIAAGAAAVAAANMFNYTEHSVFTAKRHLFEADVDVREPVLGYDLKGPHATQVS